MSASQLIVHAGGRLASYDEVASVPTPAATRTHYPVPFHHLIDAARNALSGAGYVCCREQFALSAGDQRFFGTLDLTHNLADGVTLAVGVRGSHDKAFAQSWCAGSRVFVCDNLAFSAELIVVKKHTRFGSGRFVDGVNDAVAHLEGYTRSERERIEWMQNTELSDERAESILLRAFERGILNTHSLPEAVKQWREPAFEEHARYGRSAWRLYNAITGSLGELAKRSPATHAGRTIRINSLLLPQN
jgi:hypothetical protein